MEGQSTGVQNPSKAPRDYRLNLDPDRADELKPHSLLLQESSLDSQKSPPVLTTSYTAWRSLQRRLRSAASGNMRSGETQGQEAEHAYDEMQRQRLQSLEVELAANKVESVSSAREQVRERAERRHKERAEKMKALLLSTATRQVKS